MTLRARCSSCKQIVDRRENLDAEIIALNESDDAKRCRILAIETEIASLCERLATQLQVAPNQQDQAWMMKLHTLTSQLGGEQSEKAMALHVIASNAETRQYMQRELRSILRQYAECTHHLQ